MSEEKNIADVLGVAVEYKNKEMETICAKKYTLNEYTSLISLDIKRIIMDVEDLVYLLEGGASKDEWSPTAIKSFARIRHKLLDRAGDIERLTDSLYIDEDGAEEAIFVKQEAMDKGRGAEVLNNMIRQFFNS